MKPKQMAVLAVLVVAAVAAIYFGVSRMGTKPTPPDSALAKIELKVDEKSGETVVLSIGEWMKLGSKAGKFKNPKAGTFTMCPPLICSECKEIIAAPVLDIERLDKPEAIAMDELMKTFKCAKCGKKPIPSYRPSPEEAAKISKLLSGASAQ